MKSQDLGVLLKLISLEKQESAPPEVSRAEKVWPHQWRDWEDYAIEEFVETIEYDLVDGKYINKALYSVRWLEIETGISKTQISLALQRCYEVGLAYKDRYLDIPRANTRALFNFIVHGLKYVFPAKPGELVRGIATSYAAPVLEHELQSAGDYKLVWPDPNGKTKGLAVEPLFKSATYCIRRDPNIYAMLALIDAIRLGHPREVNLATSMLKDYMELDK